MAWVAELSDNNKILVPTQTKDKSENILRYGLKALLRRLLRSREYLRLVADGVRVRKFINLRTGEEIPFSGTHAGFPELFAALMEGQTNKAMYHQVKFFVGAKEITEPEPLDFEGSLITSVKSKVETIPNIIHMEPTGLKSFRVIQRIENPQPFTPFVIEHHFSFKD